MRRLARRRSNVEDIEGFLFDHDDPTLHEVIAELSGDELLFPASLDECINSSLRAEVHRG